MPLKNLYKVIEGLQQEGQKIDKYVIARLVRECSKVNDKALATGILVGWAVDDKIIK